MTQIQAASDVISFEKQRAKLNAKIESIHEKFEMTENIDIDEFNR